MDKNIIDECLKLSLSGQSKFPEIAKKLIADGVERYIVDLVGLRAFYFGVKNEIYDCTLSLNQAKNVAEYFNTEEVENIVNEVMGGNINYPTFLNRIIEAGCSHYTVFMKGKKVIYFGRDGSSYTQLFPKAN